MTDKLQIEMEKLNASLTKQIEERAKKDLLKAIEDMRSLDVRCRLCKHSKKNSSKQCSKTILETEGGKCFVWRGI